MGLAISASQKKVFGHIGKLSPNEWFSEYPKWVKMEPERERVCPARFLKRERFPRREEFRVL